MLAAVVTRYGPPEVLQIVDLPKPVPGPGQVLVRVHAAPVSSGDTRVRGLRVPRGMSLMVRLGFGFSKPRQPILGFELAGVVESVGSGVKRFNPGDRVFACTGMTLGAQCQYRLFAETDPIVPMPEGMSFNDASVLCFGTTTAMWFFREAKLKAGESVLVNGASGAVGVAMIQLAKHMGCTVTAVCSGANAELVRGLGADQVIDYTKADFTAAGERWDVIADCVGNAPYSRIKPVLNDGGRYLLVYGELLQMLGARFVGGPHRVISGTAPDSLADVQQIAALAGTGALKPVVDRVYPLAEIAAAHRYVEAGHKRGSVVVTLPVD